MTTVEAREQSLRTDRDGDAAKTTEPTQPAETAGRTESLNEESRQADPRSPQPEPLHDSAFGHVQGSAHYIDDLSRREAELRVAWIGSPVARGRLVHLDLDAVRAAPGVRGVYTANDIPGHNRFGAIFEDEPFLADRELMYIGQPIAVVAAETETQARAAASLATVEVEQRSPILTIEDADAAGEYLGVERFIRRGEAAEHLEQSAHRLEGRFRCKGQEQFYLESQAALVEPVEGTGMVVHSSTQAPTEIQTVVADLLGWSRSRVVCEVLRLGGGFGGKETQAALPAALAALVAHHTQRPVRVVYGKDEDMLLTGKRHEFLTRYRVGFDDEGRILAAHFQVRSNGGAYADLSTAVLERCMLHLDNAYYLPHVEIGARVCKTNLPPNTAFRGFGGPQGIAVIEHVIEEIARHLGRDALDVRRVNLYSDDEQSPRAVTPYGQTVRNNLMPGIAAQLEVDACYRQRRQSIDAFNQRAGSERRGLSMVPVKFGISFTNKTLNQGNALVNVYADGTLQVSTGATEMGQGVYTKIAMIAAQEFGLPREAVVVMKTSTEKNNNTSPTAASASTDINGAATVDACRTIRARLARFAARWLAERDEVGEPGSVEDIQFVDGRVWNRRRPTASVTFRELCHAAYVERIDLGARGFFATPNVDFDRETGQGTPFAYYTTGWCAAEVEVDVLIGTLTIRRLDVLMDIGRPINLGIERGQVIGGLIQGIGWVTAEELVYNGEGRLLTLSPTTYKIPAIRDLPADFSVRFVDNPHNTHNVRSTKAVGEPPLMLGVAVWTAVKDALAGVADPQAWSSLGLPATHEEIARVAAGVAAEEWYAEPR